MSGDSDRIDGEATSAIPSRNTSWASPFSDPVAVNADADHTREVPVFSAGHRVVAITISVMLLGWIAFTVHQVATRGGFVGDAGTEASIGLRLYVIAVVRLAIAALVAWGIWRWANRPVARVKA